MDMDMIDISAYVVGFDIATEPDDTALQVVGLQAGASITIGGTWERPNYALADLIVRAHFRGRRAPRKSKKAMKKFYAGAATTPRERRRVSRLTFVAV